MVRKLRGWMIVGLVAGTGLVAAACLPVRNHPPAPGTSAERPLSKRLCKGTAAPDHYEHVVVVVMENKTWSDVLNGQGPFLTALKDRCATATNYQQSASPSRPNYIALTAGATYG